MSDGEADESDVGEEDIGGISPGDEEMAGAGSPVGGPGYDPGDDQLMGSAGGDDPSQQLTPEQRDRLDKSAYRDRAEQYMANFKDLTVGQALRHAAVDDWEAQMAGKTSAEGFPLTLGLADFRAALAGLNKGGSRDVFENRFKNIVAQVRRGEGFEDLTIGQQTDKVQAALGREGVGGSSGRGIFGLPAKGENENLRDWAADNRLEIEGALTPGMLGVGTPAMMGSILGAITGKTVMGQITDDDGNTFNVHEDGTLSPGEVPDSPDDVGGTWSGDQAGFGLARPPQTVAPSPDTGALTPQQILSMLINQQFIQRDKDSRSLLGGAQFGGQARRVPPPSGLGLAGVDTLG